MLLDSEWLVGVKYEHLTPTLVFQPTVMLVRSRDQRVKATVAIRVHISREAALLRYGQVSPTEFLRETVAPTKFLPRGFLLCSFLRQIIVIC